MKVEFEICEMCGRAIAIGNEYYYNNKVLCEKCFEKELEKNAEGVTIKSRRILVRIRRLPKVQKPSKKLLHPTIEELLKLVKV